MSHPSRFLAPLFWLASSLVMSSAGAVTVTTPASRVPVEPGKSATISFVFGNEAPAPSGNLEFAITSLHGVQDYSVEPLPANGCSGFHDDIVPGWRAFTVDSIAPGATRTCQLRITRGAQEIDNAFFNSVLRGTDQWISFDMGTFADIRLSAEPVSSNVDGEGVLREVFRFEARNTGAIDVEGVVVGLGPVCVGGAIGVDTNLPGGCAADRIECGFTGGPAPAARLPLLRSGTTESCLVRFTAAPGVERVVEPYVFSDPLRNAATGGSVGYRGDTALPHRLELVTPAAPRAMAVPATSAIACALLGLLVALAAWLKSRALPFGRR